MNISDIVQEETCLAGMTTVSTRSRTLDDRMTIRYHQRRPIAEGHIKTSNAVNGTERIEEDALGNVEVPSEHLWGAQTERSSHNFPIGVERYRGGQRVIRALKKSLTESWAESSRSLSSRPCRIWSRSSAGGFNEFLMLSGWVLITGARL